LRAMARRPGLIRAAILTAPMIDIARNRIQFWLFEILSLVMVTCGLGHVYVAGERGYSELDRDFSCNILTHNSANFVHKHQIIAINPDLAPGGPTWAWLHATLRSIRKLRAEATAGLVTSPVLIVSAGDDRVVSNPAQADLNAFLPNGELVCISGSYHEILQEGPVIQAALWDYAKAFLARVTHGVPPAACAEH
jgi:lysophospholipase